MPNRDIGLEALSGIKEIKEFKKGKKQLVTKELSDPSPPKAIRQRLELTQKEFSRL